MILNLQRKNVEIEKITKNRKKRLFLKWTKKKDI